MDAAAAFHGLENGVQPHQHHHPSQQADQQRANDDVKRQWADLEAQRGGGGSERSTLGRIVDSHYFPHAVLLSAQVTGERVVAALLCVCN